MMQGPDVYGGTRASYLALCATALLALSLLSGLWSSDGSGTLGLLALTAVYIGSQELLLLFVVLAPFSVLLDFSRLGGVPHGTHGRGWFVFFTLLEVVAKGAGTAFAWSLHRSAATGEVVNNGSTAPGSNRLPSWGAPPPPPVSYGSSGAAGGSGYTRLDDPFTAAYVSPGQDMAAAAGRAGSPTRAALAPTSGASPAAAAAAAAGAPGPYTPAVGPAAAQSAPVVGAPSGAHQLI